MEMVQEQALSVSKLENMTDEELIMVYRNEHKLAIEVLVQRYKKFVRTKIKAKYYLGADKEDLIQEGMIGLFKAINEYNPTKETSFKSFATLCVTRQVSTAFKTVSRQKHMPLNSSISLSIPVGSRGNEEDDEVTLMDVLKSNQDLTPEDEIIDQENLKVLSEHIHNVLSEMEWRVLSLYTEGRNYHEISKILNKPLKSIDNTLQRIKRKLEDIKK